MSESTGSLPDEVWDQLEEDLAHCVDSCFAEHGSDVTKEDIQQTISGLLSGYREEF